MTYDMSSGTEHKPLLHLSLHTHQYFVRDEGEGCTRPGVVVKIFNFGLLLKLKSWIDYDLLNLKCVKWFLIMCRFKAAVHFTRHALDVMLQVRRANVLWLKMIDVWVKLVTRLLFGLLRSDEDVLQLQQMLNTIVSARLVPTVRSHKVRTVLLFFCKLII